MSPRGGQWINTGILANEGICTEVKFKINTFTSNSQVIFGKVGNNNFGIYTRYWFGARGISRKWYYGMNNYSDTTVNADSDIHTVLLDTVDNVCVLDGSTIATFGNLNPNNETIYLFCANYGVNGIVSQMSGRIYYTKIYNNSIIVRDFIPVRIGNVGYMYDKVSGQLFANAGTGNFILGPDK